MRIAHGQEHRPNVVVECQTERSRRGIRASVEITLNDIDGTHRTRHRGGEAGALRNDEKDETNG
jgi:hypothetical protein